VAQTAHLLLPSAGRIDYRVLSTKTIINQSSLDGVNGFCFKKKGWIRLRLAPK